MSSLQPLREFIKERLSAAAEEICRHLEETIGHYEAELERQRGLLDICGNRTHTLLHSAAFPKHFLIGDGDPWDQGATSTMHHDGRGVPLIKGELYEFSISQDEQQLGLKLETNTPMVTPARKNSGLDLNVEQVRTLSHAVTDTQDQEESNSTTSEDTEHDVDDDNASIMSENQSESASSENLRVPERVERDIETPNKDGPSCNDTTSLLTSACGSDLATKTQAKKKSFSCKVCGKGFNYKLALINHKRNHTAEKPFCCSECGRRFSRKCHLANHLGAHKRGKPFSCVEGKRSFSPKAGLDRNLEAHKESRLFSCTKCGQEFNDRSVLQLHLETHKIVIPLCDSLWTTSEEESELQSSINTDYFEQEAFSSREDSNVHDFDSTQFSFVSKPESQNQSGSLSCTSLNGGVVSSEQIRNSDTKNLILIHASPVNEAHLDGCPTTFPEGDSNSALSIPAVQRKDNGSRLYTKKQYCLFCKRGYSKMARHLESLHYNEAEVAQAMAFPKGSKERKLHLEHLRNRGNFAHNLEVLSIGTGNLVPRQQPKAPCQAQDFQHCGYCQVLLRKTSLQKHMASCKYNPSTARIAGLSEDQSFGALASEVSNDRDVNEVV